MNTLLWIAQTWLALLFIYSGIMKSTQRRELLVQKGQTGVAGLSYPFIRFIGIAEILGSVGIILPWLTGICSVITPLTAVCFSVLMLLAASVHYKRGEYKQAILVNGSTFIISLLVALYRF